MNDIKRSGMVDCSFEGYYLKADFNRLFPLKKEYWNNKRKIELNFMQDYKNDEKLIKYWKMSEILVSPDGQINGTDYFSFGIPLFKNTPSKDVELYIKNLNLVVDTQAKHAAFYSLGKPIKTSWLEHHKEIENTINLEEAKN